MLVIDGELGKTRKHLDQVVKSVPHSDPGSQAPYPEDGKQLAKEPQSNTHLGSFLDHEHQTQPLPNNPKLDLPNSDSKFNIPNSDDFKNSNRPTENREISTRISTRNKRPIDRLTYSKLGGE